MNDQRFQFCSGYTRVDHGEQRRAFSLIELLVIIAIIALLVSIVLPALTSARRSARTALCQSNLRQMMVAHNGYAAHNRDYFAAYAGSGLDGPGQPSSHAYAARSVLMRLTGRDSGPDVIPVFQNTFVAGTGTFVIEQFTHLLLADYLGEQISPVTVCSEDRPRLSWRASPLTISASPHRPTENRNTVNLAWWPYSGSYQLSPWACGGGMHPSYHQDKLHDTYSAKVILRRKWTELAFPAQKVALQDTQDRHFARAEIFYAFEECRQPLAFFDGSISNRQTADANEGQDAFLPLDNVPCRFSYSPDLGFESRLPTKMNPKVKGYYRWTRGGLRGVDFGGREAATALSEW